MMADSNVASLAVREEPTGSSLIRPAADLATIKQAFGDYQLLCRELLDDDDFQQIGSKKHPKKSAWRKLSIGMGVSLSNIRWEHTRDEKGRIVRSEFLARATASNGRFADGWGLCDIHEKCCEEGCTKRGGHKHCPAAQGQECSGVRHFSHAEHDIPATAETRAKNRAASDLFGMGEVSAEEILSPGEVHDGLGSDYIDGEVVEDQPARQPKAQRPASGQDLNKLKTAIVNHPKFKALKGKPGWSITEISKLSPAGMAARLAELEGKPQGKPQAAPEQPEPATVVTEAAAPETETPEIDWSLERKITFARDAIESMSGWEDKYKAIYGAVVEAAVMGNDLESLNDVLDHMRAEAAEPAEVVEQ
jgi:hypothetical protein